MNTLLHASRFGETKKVNFLGSIDFSILIVKDVHNKKKFQTEKNQRVINIFNSFVICFAFLKNVVNHLVTKAICLLRKTKRTFSTFSFLLNFLHRFDFKWTYWSFTNSILPGTCGGISTMWFTIWHTSVSSPENSKKQMFLQFIFKILGKFRKA